MVQIRSALLVPLVLAGLAGTAPLAHAEDFYKGKTLNIVVGFSPGGGYDVNARTVARHIGKHIPGNPNVIVQNAPGAGSFSSVRSLDATAAKDGTVVNVFNAGLVTRSVVEPEKFKVDFSNFHWVGTITTDFRVCYGFGPKGVKSWEDMMKRQAFILGSTAKGAGNYINAATLRLVFKAPVKQVLGFPGSAEQRLAIERGELDGDCGSFSSIPVDWIKEGKAHPFVRFLEQRGPGIPESAAYIGKFANKEQLQLLDVLNAADEIGRPFIMSKQVPMERVAILRKAFTATMKDPAFLADAAKLQLPVFPLTGEEAEKVVAKMKGAPPAVAAQAKKVFE